MHQMLTTAQLGTGRRRARWSMTTEMMNALASDAARLANEADHTGGYITAFFDGEPDAPTLVPNIPGQRLVHQLSSVRQALARAKIERDAGLAVIGRRVTLEETDGTRTTYTLAIPGEGNPTRGSVSVASPVGRAIYLRQVGEQVTIDAPAGAWSATVVLIE